METAPTPNVAQPPTTLARLLSSIPLLLSMLAHKSGPVVNSATKIFLHLVSSCNTSPKFKSVAATALTSSRLFNAFVVDLYKPETEVKCNNILKSSYAEVREVFSMIVQVLGTVRGGWVRGEVREVLQAHLSMGKLGRFEGINIRSCLEGSAGLSEVKRVAVP